MTDWLVYRCEVHKKTTYVNANPRPPTAAEAAELAANPGQVWAQPAPFCCDQAKMVAVADEPEFVEALRSLKVR